jgi:hypothetical protein
MPKLLWRCNLWNENNSLRNVFIGWSRWYCATGLNTEPKVVGREQDSEETEREIVWVTERCWKWEVAWAINLIVGENIHCRCGRIIWDDLDDGYWFFSQAQNIFSVNLLMTFCLTDKSQILYTTSSLFGAFTSCKENKVLWYMRMLV